MTSALVRVTAVLFLGSGLPLFALTLVDNGRPAAVIVVEDSANEAHATAARDLQVHVERASGETLPILNRIAESEPGAGPVKLVVGAGKLSAGLGVRVDDLAPEAFRVQTRGNAIVFVGADTTSSNATSWAVAAFLDRYLGVRWLWPGELGTHVPTQKTIAVSEIDFTDRPALEQRRLRSSARGATADWLRRHQMGSRMKYGFGHAFVSWWEKYNKTHPEYFAVPPEGYQQPYPQPDRVKLRIGNPAVADQIIEEWRRAGRPDNWNVSPNDGGGWDTSAESRELDLPDVFTPEDIWRSRANLSRRFVRFWNGLLVRMRQENPNVTLSTYAYSAYREAPPDIQLEPGMVLGVVHSYADTSGWRKWHEAGAKLILRPNWWYMGGSAPHVPLRAQGEYFRFAQAHGMIGFDFDSLTAHWGNQGALYYLIARLSTRPDLSIDDAIDEYTSAFGAAAPVIRDYLRYWEDYTERVASPVPAGGEVSQNPDGLYETLARKHDVRAGVLASAWTMMQFLYTDDVIAPAEAMLERARQVTANDDPIVRRRIEFLVTSLGLMREHREVVRLSDKKHRRAGESDRDFKRQLERFETLREKARAEYGPIGFEPTLVGWLKVKDPRKMEGL